LEGKSFTDFYNNDPKKEIKKTELVPWQDENFYYIAGYTPGGVPFGITWEEYERDIKDDNDKKDEVNYSIKEEKKDNHDSFDEDMNISF